MSPHESSEVGTSVIIVPGGPPVEKWFIHLSNIMISGSSSSSIFGRNLDICSLTNRQSVFIQISLPSLAITRRVGPYIRSL